MHRVYRGREKRSGCGGFKREDLTRIASDEVLVGVKVKRARCLEEKIRLEKLHRESTAFI